MTEEVDISLHIFMNPNISFKNLLKCTNAKTKVKKIETFNLSFVLLRRRKNKIHVRKMTTIMSTMSMYTIGNPASHKNDDDIFI